MNMKTIALFIGIFMLTIDSSFMQKCEDAAGTAVACPVVCQEETPEAKLLPTATVCEDKRSNCDVLFYCDGIDCLDTNECPAGGDANCNAEDPAIGGPNVRAYGCTNPEFRDVALECAKTCAMCCETPEYNCEDETTIVCADNIAKCNDPAWTDTMSQLCPATCGLCNSGTGCTDNNSGCKEVENLCRDIEFHTFMEENCARTCDLCSSTNTTTAPGSAPGSSCQDIASNCAQNANLCTNNLYSTLMSQNCCGTCSSSSSSSSCTDSNSNCVNWVRNGFCTSNFYTTAQKQQYCASSCGYC